MLNDAILFESLLLLGKDIWCGNQGKIGLPYSCILLNKYKFPCVCAYENWIWQVDWWIAQGILSHEEMLNSLYKNDGICPKEGETFVYPG